MPVKTSGRRIYEPGTGKTVGYGKTADSAKASARARNAAWRKKKQRKGRFGGTKPYWVSTASGKGTS